MENAIQQHTVVCDNPACDYKVVNKTGKVDLEELKKYINRLYLKIKRSHR